MLTNNNVKMINMPGVPTLHMEQLQLDSAAAFELVLQCRVYAQSLRLCSVRYMHVYCTLDWQKAD
jgi:hypothetical protein